MQIKEKGIIRVACRNIKLVPMNQSNTRNEEIILAIHNGEFDIIGLTEVSVAWNNIETENQPKERFKGCFETVYIVTSNLAYKESKEKRQYGGTLSISEDRYAISL
jgi:hypothetical protein